MATILIMGTSASKDTIEKLAQIQVPNIKRIKLGKTLKMGLQKQGLVLFALRKKGFWFPVSATDPLSGTMLNATLSSALKYRII